MDGTTPLPRPGPASVCRATAAEEAEFAGLLAVAPSSLAEMFRNRVRDTPTLESYRRTDSSGGWSSATWEQTGQAVEEIAAGLLALGLQPQDRVALACATRVEWIEADLGVLCAGGATSTVYPTSTPQDVRHILTDCGARFAIAENAEQLGKLKDGAGTDSRVGVGSQGCGLERIVVIDDDLQRQDDDTVLSLAALRELGVARLADDPDAVARSTAAVRPDQLATLIYTSGTTGRPKGVRLPHSAWVYAGLTTPAMRLLTAEDLEYLWLPMSHAFGKTLLASQLATGHPTALDGDPDRIIVNLPVVRPHTMAAVPRVFEKVHAGIWAAVREQGGAKLAIFRWAIGVGLKVSRLQQGGERPGPLLAAQHAVADRLVFSTVRERFGGRIKFVISGAATLSVQISEFFHAVGILVLEGYGVTESSAGGVLNRPDRFEFGTVGSAFPGTEVRLDPDGEILLRSPGVMQGYEHLDDATAETLSADGWLRTGDVGEFTERGALRITDRKKDLIKTSNGKYVAPQAIETQLKLLCQVIGQVVVHGDGRTFVSALIALDADADAVAKWAAGGELAGRPFAELAGSPGLRDVVQQAVEELNQRVGRWEAIRKFEILDRDLTVADGDLTPSLKLRRRAVERRYADVLDSFYSS